MKNARRKNVRENAWKWKLRMKEFCFTIFATLGRAWTKSNCVSFFVQMKSEFSTRSKNLNILTILFDYHFSGNFVIQPRSNKFLPFVDEKQFRFDSVIHAVKVGKPILTLLFNLSISFLPLSNNRQRDGGFCFCQITRWICDLKYMYIHLLEKKSLK